MALVLTFWLYRNGGTFDITKFYDTLVILVPSSFLAGVAIGVVAEHATSKTSLKLNKYLWICNVLAYFVVWFLASPLQFTR